MSDRLILVVEDSDEDYEATARAFRRCPRPRNLRRCTSGDEAMDLLLCRGADAGGPLRPAVILLDLNLPGSDGREVLLRLKSEPRTQAIPVVVLTTSSNPRDIDACYRRGAAGYIVKPVDFARFAEAIAAFGTYWIDTVTFVEESIR